MLQVNCTLVLLSKNSYYVLVIEQEEGQTCYSQDLQWSLQTIKDAKMEMDAHCFLETKRFTLTSGVQLQWKGDFLCEACIYFII